MAGVEWEDVAGHRRLVATVDLSRSQGGWHKATGGAHCWQHVTKSRTTAIKHCCDETGPPPALPRPPPLSPGRYPAPAWWAGADAYAASRLNDNEMGAPAAFVSIHGQRLRLAAVPRGAW